MGFFGLLGTARKMIGKCSEKLQVFRVQGFAASYFLLPHLILAVSGGFCRFLAVSGGSGGFCSFNEPQFVNLRHFCIFCTICNPL